ncbi:MAG: hypothetical protein FWG87_09005 [Defluviitaleaceae bacterium]|nr:hypothetical protein [Defluviitaleaceae bacterium]
MATNEMMERVHAKITSVLLPTDTSSNAPPPTSFVSLMLPGETVIPEDFDLADDNGRSNLFKRMEVVPTFNKRYADSGNTVSGMFSRILGATVPADDPVKKAEKQKEFNAAQETLEKYSELYDEKQDDYNEAFFAYLEAKEEKESKVTISKLQTAMDKAKKAWEGAGRKREVENALAIVSRFMAYTPVSIFAEAQNRFEREKDEYAVEGALPVLCIPQSWATEQDNISWARVSISQSSEVARVHKSTEVINSGWGGGFFFASHASSSTQINDKASESLELDDFEMSFEIARITLNRSWFNGGLMTIPGVTMDNTKKGGFSAGSLEKAGSAPNSFLPTAIILARDIRASVTLSKEAAEVFASKLSSQSNTRVGIGPFSINRSTAINRKSSSSTSSNNAETFEFEIGNGMQIIGVISSILPEFPMTDYTASKGKKLRDYGKNELSVLPTSMLKTFSKTDTASQPRHSRIRGKGGKR